MTNAKRFRRSGQSLLALLILACSLAAGGAASAQDAGANTAPGPDSNTSGTGATKSAPQDPLVALQSHVGEAKAIIAEALTSLVTYKVAGSGLSMQYPKTFTFKDTAIAGQGLFGVSSMGGIVNVSWSSQELNESVGTNLETYAKSNKDSVAGLSSPEYKFSKFVSEKTIKNNGIEQRRILVDSETSTNGAAIPLRQLMLISVIGNTGYVMCGTSPAVFYQFVEPLFDKMGNSFKNEPASTAPAK